MGAQTPEAATQQMISSMESGDIDGVMDLYEPEAVFIELDGVSRGLAEIRLAQERFLASGLTLKLHDHVSFQADDIALVQWSWTVTDAEGASADGVSAEVLRRQPDGTWKFIVDNSDGAAMIGLKARD